MSFDAWIAHAHESREQVYPSFYGTFSIRLASELAIEQAF